MEWHGCGSIYHGGPRVVKLAVLDAGQRVVQPLEHRFVMRARWHDDVLAHVGDLLDGADDGRGTGAEHFQ